MEKPTSSNEVISQPELIDAKYSKRAIISNVGKYKEIAEEKNEQLLAADFSKLLSNPQSVGAHFQFKDEKSWTNTSSSIEKANKLFSSYFNLNLSLLNESITTIPLHKRIDIDESLFTEKEMNDMNDKAKFNREKYDRILTNQKTDEEILVDKMMDIMRPSNKSETAGNQNLGMKITQKPTKSDIPQTISNLKTDQKPSNIRIKESPESNIMQSNLSYNFIESKLKVESNNVENIDKIETKLKPHESDDELDDLLQQKSTSSVNMNSGTIKIAKLVEDVNITEPNEIKAIQCVAEESKPIITENKEDIQKWLDDVLND